MFAFTTSRVNVSGTFKEVITAPDNCTLLTPGSGFKAERLLKCAAQCFSDSDTCEGFIFSEELKSCKLVGSSGTLSSDCSGKYYTIIY